MKWMLFLHVLGVVMFLGNIITAAFWKIRAEYSKDIGLLHKVVKNVMIADFVFTLPGIILIVLTGHFMAAKLGYSVFEFSWLGISYGLFLLTGAIWLFVLLPAQLGMIKQSQASISTGALTSEYKKLSRRWDLFGIIATLIPIVVLILMTVKPY